MPELYLGQWEWFTDADGDSYWRSPGGDPLGALDLRSNAQAGQPGPTPEGYGLFVYAAPTSHPNLVRALGSNLDRNLTGGEKAAIRAFFDVPGSTPVMDTIRGAMRQWMLDSAYYDVASTTRWKPIRGSLGRPVEFMLGGFGTVFSESFTSGHPAFAATLAQFRVDYMRNREGARIPLDVLRQWTGATMLRLFGRMSDSEAQAILPPPYTGDGWLPPSTIITDNFNRADESLDAGPWVEHSQNWSVTSNQVTIAGTTGFARHTTALSSDDHKAKITVVTYNSVIREGVTARFSTDLPPNEDAYIVRVLSTTALNYVKKVNGTETTLDTNKTISTSAPDDVEIEVNNSTMISRFNGTVAHNFTDTALTGNLYCGMAARGNAAVLDDFSAQDLAAARTWLALTGVGN